MSSPKYALPALGPYIRIVPLTTSDLPAHPALLPPDSGVRPDLGKFINDVLTEAKDFSQITIPQTFAKTSVKSSAPAAAKVQLLKRLISASELADVAWEARVSSGAAANAAPRVDEAWFARLSRHEDKSEAGTAAWGEFDNGLRVAHSENEMDYTHNIYDAVKVLDWEEQTRTLQIGNDVGEVGMRVFEMCHELPAPFQPRVFSVLVITAQLELDSFCVIQIPIDLSQFGGAFYSNGRNLRDGDSALKKKNTVQGVYTSIEFCRHYTANTNEVTWLAATASDAKGNIPMAMQKMALPGALLKDVGLFMKWVAAKRQ